MDLTRDNLVHRSGVDELRGRVDRLAKVERELQQARAEALGRTGERLQGLLEQLAALDRRLDALLVESGRAAPSSLLAAEVDIRNRLRDEAMRVRQNLVIQREAVGLRRQASVEQCYPVPERRQLPGAGRRPGEGTMTDERTRHDHLLARIARGERIEARDEMSATYRDSLVHLMTMQADSELAGAYGYVPWIMKAPSVEEKLVVAQIVKDETRHAKVMYDLLAELGVDVGTHVGTHDQSFARRLDDSEADIGTARVASDKRVNIFYYPIDTWADFVMFNFCMDRGAGHQLEDVRHSSYGPWRRGVEGIFKEERMHIRHGELWVKRLADDPTARDDAERTLHKWYVRTMNIFGRPGTPKNRLYRELGLKQRDNDEVRRTFADEVRSLVEVLGWRVPDWKPAWDTLPEEAQIPG